MVFVKLSRDDSSFHLLSISSLDVITPLSALLEAVCPHHGCLKLAVSSIKDDVQPAIQPTRKAFCRSEILWFKGFFPFIFEDDHDFASRKPKNFITLGNPHLFQNIGFSCVLL